MSRIKQAIATRADTALRAHIARHASSDGHYIDHGTPLRAGIATVLVVASELGKKDAE